MRRVWVKALIGGLLSVELILIAMYMNLVRLYCTKSQQSEQGISEWRISFFGRLPNQIFCQSFNGYFVLKAVSVPFEYDWKHVTRLKGIEMNNKTDGTMRKLSVKSQNVNNSLKATSETTKQLARITDSKTKRKTGVKRTKTKSKQTSKVTKTQKCKHPVLPRFICDDKSGRLGNQMFSFASTYGIAAHLNRTLVVATSRFIHKIFTLDAIGVDECVCLETKLKRAKKNSSFDKNLFNLNQNENYRVGRFLQSWRYFEDVVPQIRNQFKFKQAVYDKALKVLNKIKGDFFKNQTRVKAKSVARNITFVGVHIRRGDIMTKKKKKQYGYAVAPQQYIEKAMKFFMENFTDVLFLVCSDNMTWTVENVKDPNAVYIMGNSPEVDLSILSQCNHTITTVGTYGWWAGFLAGGITLYYKHPAKENSKLRSQFTKDYSDFFYPGWIGME